MEGYVKIWRKIFKCAEWLEKPFDKARAWLDLILLANSQDNEIEFEGAKIMIKRGQHLTSYYKLAQRWGWHHSTLEKQVKIWEKERRICALVYAEKARVITIINYDLYNESAPKMCGDLRRKGATNNIIYNNIYSDVPSEGDLNKRGMTDWQTDVSCVNRRLRGIDKLEKGDPKLCAMMLKRHGFVLTVAKIEQIAENQPSFKDARGAKAYLIASLKKTSVGNSPGANKGGYDSGYTCDYRNFITDEMSGREN